MMSDFIEILEKTIDENIHLQRDKARLVDSGKY